MIVDHVPREPQASVFIVDDDIDMRESLALLMSALGYSVESFASGRDFLDRAAFRGAGCLLLDLRMPELDGLDVLAALRERDYSVPAVMISGQADVRCAVIAMRSGAFDFFEKPYEPRALIESVRKAVSRSTEARGAARRYGELRERYVTLSVEERKVMSMVIAGNLECEIAKNLDCSRRTAQLRRASVMRKMLARSLPELVEFALALGHVE